MKQFLLMVMEKRGKASNFSRWLKLLDEKWEAILLSKGETSGISQLSSFFKGTAPTIFRNLSLLLEIIFFLTVKEDID